MTLGQLLRGIETRIAPDAMAALDAPVTALAWDSRDVVPGALFVALPGSVTDGHAFLAQARERGALAALVQRADALPPGLIGAVADDTHAALAVVAHRFYGDPSAAVRLIGVTGTNGKTSVTYQLEAMLAAAGRKVGVLGTINYRYAGCSVAAPNTTPNPGALARGLAEMVAAGVQDVIMEVSSHGLKLGRVAGCRFDRAAFTNLSRDHLDFHESMQDYFESKALLFTRVLPSSSKPARAVILVDSPEGRELAERCPTPLLRVSAAGAAEADLRLDVHSQDLRGLAGTLRSAAGSYDVATPLIGAFVGPNLVVAAGLALSLGLEPRQVQQGAQALAAVPGRLEPVAGASDPLVLVDYAHTDGALRNVLGAVRGLARGRVITVFGCGGDRDRGKRPLMGRAAAEGSELTVVTSDNPRTEDPQAIIEQILPGIAALGIARLDPARIHNGDRGYCVIADRAAAIATAVNAARPGDVVLIAGKGHEDYQIVGREKRHFDDREQAAAALKNRERGR